VTPTQFSDVGVQTISVLLDDGLVSSISPHNFTIEVTNTAPYLSIMMPASVTIHVNEIKTVLVQN
jgi:hypothetical protein